jgi:UDP-2,4-diacetamido-2,4,6-trideoxy-beta-L-altropyranose hydrolase
MAPRTLIIRADASVAMGTGHVMRCLALAQAWQDDGGKVVFAMARSTPALDERIRAEHVEIFHLEATAGGSKDATLTGQLAHSRHADWVVVDGYQFDEAYQCNVTRGGLKLLFVDDFGHCTHYFADLVLNQNAQASERAYRNRESYARVLLGARYAMLRREFALWRTVPREFNATGQRILVTMGGSDPDNVTERAIQALQLLDLNDLEIRILVGNSNPHLPSLERAVKQSAKAICLIRDARNIPELMAWADLAISAAGSTCWEMCLLGLPSILVDLAENQRPVAQERHYSGQNRC